MFIFWIALLVYTFVIIFGDMLLLQRDRLAWCHAAVLESQGFDLTKEYANIDSPTDPCYYERTIYLLGFSIFECDFGRRIIASVFFGAAIGFERKASERSAGIRTMSLVCLGSAMYTMCGQFAFRSSTMTWDASRVSASIPAGVGFLGSALIWKESTGQKGPHQRHHVHGITTAASVWLSASVGIGVGGGLYLMSLWTVALVVFVLRLGPTLAFQDDDCSYASDSTYDKQSNGSGNNNDNGGDNDNDWGESQKDDNDSDDDDDDEQPDEMLQREQYRVLKEHKAISGIHASISSQRIRKPTVNFHSD
jgi:uncharacterized membrane protein YhiD involved in acid resistance